MYFALTSSRTEGLFVGGSSGSALSGAIRYLHSAEGNSIAQDSEANVVIILPDGVRNYMSKPWFLDVAQDEAAVSLRGTIKGVLGRELNNPGSVLQQAEAEGTVLEKGEALRGKPDGGGDEGKIGQGVSVSVESTSSRSSDDGPTEGLAKLALVQ